MTHTPETRTTYWWSDEQLRAAGWRVSTATVEDGKQCVWLRAGEVVPCTPLPHHTAGHGAYLPEPPPPETLSDEEIRGMIVSLRRPSSTPAELYAADVVEAVHALATRTDPSLDDVFRALRRRPR